jgi:AcrR family transcriptional regulator
LFVTGTEQRPDRRAVRHAATKQEIVEAAWHLARERGLGGWSLRDVAAAVGMRAPSLYVYFDSKNALFDAMFADGCRALLDRVRPGEAEVAGRPADQVLRTIARVFFEFCLADPARYQLLFLRTLPGFEPSAESYALANDTLAATAEALAGVGLSGPEHLDLWTAVLTGLVSQQISNDPGGDRWIRLIDVAVEMFLSALPPEPVQRRSAEGPAPTIEG